MKLILFAANNFSCLQLQLETEKIEKVKKKSTEEKNQQDVIFPIILGSFKKLLIKLILRHRQTI